jgi:hypothetical protein
MGRSDSWLVLGVLGLLVVVPVLCAALAVARSSRGALAAAPRTGGTGLRERVLMVLGHDLDDDREPPLADRARSLRRGGHSLDAMVLVCAETGMTPAEAERFVVALD